MTLSHVAVAAALILVPAWWVVPRLDPLPPDPQPAQPGLALIVWQDTHPQPPEVADG